MTTVDDDATTPSLSAPETLEDPFPAYAALRAGCPVHRMPDTGVYVLLDHADVREAATDPSRFSSGPAGSRRRGSEAARTYAGILAERGWQRADTLQRTDPPVHTRYRRLLARAFTPKRVSALAPRIEELAHTLIDTIGPAGRCEFVSEFALPLPGIVIAEQLGLDESQYQTFKGWADAMLILAQRPDIGVDEAREWAELELAAQHHLAREFEARREEPRDDLISVLVHAHGPDEEPLTVEELQDLMHQLVTGGFETTTSALSKGLWLLLRHPEQMAQLRADLDGLLDNAVEEILRYDSPVQGLWRTAACPIEMGGVEIPEGAVVQLRFGAANRDPAAFDEPDVFDITRPDANQHVAFGMGPHFCIGAALAREELRISLRALLTRLDDIELDGELEAPVHESSVFLRPMRELPLRYSFRG